MMDHNRFAPDRLQHPHRTAAADLHAHPHRHIPHHYAHPGSHRHPGGPESLSDKVISLSQVQRETMELSPNTIDLRPDLLDSGACELGFAGTSFHSSAGSIEFVICMIAFEDDIGSVELGNFLYENGWQAGVVEVSLPSDASSLGSLPEGTRVLFLDPCWALYAQHGNVFIGVDIYLNVDTAGLTPNSPGCVFPVQVEMQREIACCLIWSLAVGFDLCGLL